MLKSPPHAGSDTFGTTVVKTDEYLLLAKTMTENGASLEETALTIIAIDDMLQLQRISSIITSHRFTATGRLRKNSSLLDMIDNRLNILLIDLKVIEND